MKKEIKNLYEVVCSDWHRLQRAVEMENGGEILASTSTLRCPGPGCYYIYRVVAFCENAPEGDGANPQVDCAFGRGGEPFQIPEWRPIRDLEYSIPDRAVGRTSGWKIYAPYDSPRPQTVGEILQQLAILFLRQGGRTSEGMSFAKSAAKYMPMLCTQDFNVLSYYKSGEKA